MGGSLTEEEIVALKQKQPSGVHTFVETGTYMGETTLLASKYYDHVYTVEVHEPLYQQCKEKFAALGATNIHPFLGDSQDMLRQVVPSIEGGAVYFLDAHISGYDSGWNHRERVPMMGELETILSSKIKPSLFIVDDVRLWKQKVFDWAHISTASVIERILSHGYKVVFAEEANDRLYISVE